MRGIAVKALTSRERAASSGVFFDDDSMLSTCESWKRYRGRKINQRLGVTGRFWQQDGFDHLVRSESQFGHFRRYIANNPRNAGLKTGEYIHYSRAD